MAYTRKGPDSDVYVYSDGTYINCAGCPLLLPDDPLGTSSYETPQEMIDHLEAHHTAGHKVPQVALSRLYRESGWEPDWSKPSRAVIASDGDGNGVILWHMGALSHEVEQIRSESLGDYGFDDCPQGIHVWEGIHEEKTKPADFTGSNETLMVPKGDYRSPSDEEWQALREHRCPWPLFPKGAAS